jgi:antitoxin component YwqK of YwqJK toxin-antitoxin module
MRSLMTALFVFGLFYVSTMSEVSAQAAQDFTIINKTGVTIHALYVTPHDSDDWGDDILGVDTLPNDESVDITFSRKERAKLWDLRIEDSKGAFIEWENFNLLEIKTAILYYKNGKATAVFDEKTADVRGIWLGYYEDGTISEYVWNIDQTGATSIMIQDADGGKTKSRGSIKGYDIVAHDFATKNGKVSADGNRINWSDGVVWVKSNDLIDVTGIWDGYYDDGTKSPYVWSIIQRGTSISIQDTKNGKTKSRGTFKGGKIFAQDFATQNGKLSADGRKISWSDGVVWVKQ